MELTKTELIRLRTVEMETVAQTELVSLEELLMDPSLSPETRMAAFWEQVKNPYCFLCGKTPVRVCFSPEGGELGEAITAYFTRLKR